MLFLVHMEVSLPPDMPADQADDLLTEPLEIAGGELAVRPGPGLGIEIDPDKLAHYRL